MRPPPLPPATAGLALLAALALLASAPAAAGPHVHGAATLDVAADAGTLQIALDSPLDNLLGFERAPRTDAERQRAKALVTRLRTDAALWRIDRAARCTLASVEIQAPVIGEGPPPAAGAADHAELEATWTFVCPGGAPAWVETGLFAAFPRLARLTAQLAGPRGQAQRTLGRGAARLDLPK